MNHILNNPYRVTGMLVGATAREQERQIRRLRQYIEAEQEPEDDFSFPALGNFYRNIESVEAAASKLNLDNDKINAALFWFWNGNPITDEAAFDALKGGDTETAYQIWDKLTTEKKEDGKRIWKDINEKNCSAFHNISVLSLITKRGAFVSIVLANIKFIESVYFEKFVRTVADETFRVSKKDIQISFLKPIFDTISTSRITELVNYLNEYNFSAKNDFKKIFAQNPIEKIEQAIETAKNKRKQSKTNAAKAGLELFDKTNNDLTQLRSFVGIIDLTYTSIVDKIANEILQCSIDFFNDSQEKENSTDYVEVAMKLARQAEKLAAGKLSKDRINDSIETLEKMKDKELSQGLHFLQSVKKAYETNEREIRAEVKRMMDTDIQIILGHRVINWSAVEDNIKNSINWEEVNKLLISILSDNNLKKIKESDKSEEKKEFLDLAYWLKEKSKRASTITAIIDKYKKIPPKLPFKIIASKVTNTDNKPLYTKFIRFIGLNLKIEVTTEKPIDLYVKLVNPNGSINRNSNTSPIGYSYLDSKKLTLNTKSINLLGWGNSDKCTYEIGNNLIELYVDDYMIHSTSFFVDLAPSEKLENELKKAVIKLTEIKYAEFFKSELDRATIDLTEIQKFQWFRSSSTKQTQILEQEQKISYIQQKAETEKKQQLEKQNKVIEKLKSDLQKAEY